MKVYAVISEFNPFHNGHAYLVNRVKANVNDAAVVAVMSGSFVQRGDAAVLDKFARAEAAVLSGVDLVLELPAPWCFSGAEFFAQGGVAVASGIGICDTLVFGSESGDIDVLTRVADGFDTEEFARAYNDARLSDKRLNTAELRAEIYSELYGCTDVFCGSNNLLALEYIKAANKLSSGLQLETVKRTGGDFNSNELSGICSASAIRQALRRGETDFSDFMPEASWEIMKRELDFDRTYDISKLDTAIIAMLRTCEPSVICRYMEVDGGIENALCDAALESKSISELVEKVKNKRFSASRIRRALLSCMLGATMSNASVLPGFTNVLAANEKGRQLLSAAKMNSHIAVLSKYSDASKLTGETARQYALHLRAERLFELCCVGEHRKCGAVMV